MTTTPLQQEECTRQECEHWESKSPAFYGHCLHAFCLNYAGACPRHQTPVRARPSASC